MPIAVEVVTQEKLIFREQEADMVVIPGIEGEMGVLPHHAPVLTTLGYGELTVRKGRAEEHFVIYGGVVDVRPDKVVVLADLAEDAYALDEAAIESARESARKLLAEGLPPERNQEAAVALQRAELALKIQRKIRSRGTSPLRIIENGDQVED
ncbi:MAG: ATP synthase F1 subunit epsilon [Anaerolineae bacterium]